MLYWNQLEANIAIGLKRTPRVREARVDGRGMFSICGVPANLQGSLRASRGKQTTADVDINAQGDLITFALLHVASPDTAPPPPPPPPVVASGKGPATTSGASKRGRDFALALPSWLVVSRTSSGVPSSVRR